MKKFLRNTLMLTSFAAMGEKAVAQSDDNATKVNATIGYTSFSTPARHTQRPLSVGIEAVQPLNTIFPVSLYAGLDVPLMGNAGQERKSSNYPVRADKDKGPAFANLALGGKLQINFVDNDDAQFGLLTAVSANALLTRKDNKMQVGVIPKFNFGLAYEQNKWSISATIGKWFQRTPLANSYVADPNAAITGNQWLEDPGIPPTLFEVKAGIRLF